MYRCTCICVCRQMQGLYLPMPCICVCARTHAPHSWRRGDFLSQHRVTGRSEPPPTKGFAVKEGQPCLMAFCQEQALPMERTSPWLSCLFILFYFLRWGLTESRLFLNFLCSGGWPWPVGPPASTSQVLRFQTWAATPGLCDFGDQT